MEQEGIRIASLSNSRCLLRGIIQAYSFWLKSLEPGLPPPEATLHGLADYEFQIIAMDSELNVIGVLLAQPLEVKIDSVRIVLEFLFVDPRYRRQGIAGRLLNSFDDEAAGFYPRSVKEFSLLVQVEQGNHAVREFLFRQKFQDVPAESDSDAPRPRRLRRSMYR
jgi:GNAT superfamily N-acetyltransferase